MTGSFRNIILATKPKSEEHPMVSELFQVHKLNEDGMKRAEQIAESFDKLLKILAGICPPGREYSIVLTKLEEASFFAKKSMANERENQL